ncbi:hypothetical protein ACFX2I_025885 [Malus domestica]
MAQSSAAHPIPSVTKPKHGSAGVFRRSISFSPPAKGFISPSGHHRHRFRFRETEPGREIGFAIHFISESDSAVGG